LRVKYYLQVKEIIDKAAMEDFDLTGLTTRAECRLYVEVEQTFSTKNLYNGNVIVFNSAHNTLLIMIQWFSKCGPRTLAGPRPGPGLPRDCFYVPIVSYSAEMLY
jgi:hypothetical protein